MPATTATMTRAGTVCIVPVFMSTLTTLLVSITPKQEQDKNAADVDQDLRDGEEVGAEERVEPRHAEEGEEKREGGVDDVPREDDDEAPTRR